MGQGSEVRGPQGGLILRANQLFHSLRSVALALSRAANVQRD